MIVAWRYQRKEGWGDIWRVTTVLPTFETPADWRVDALGVVGAVEPSPNGGVVRHDIEVDHGPLDTRGARLLDTRGFADDEPLIFDIGEGVICLADIKYLCPILGTCPHWLDKCLLIGCQHPEAVEMRMEPKAK